MKTGELAERLNVAPQTVRNYTEEYADFLSEEAAGAAPNAKRNYSEKDALVLGTVAELRSKGLRPEQIRTALKDGKLLESLPEIPTPDEKEVRRNIALVPLAEYQRLADLVRVKENELARVLDERDKALLAADEANRRTAALSSELGQVRDKDVSELNRRIAELSSELGQARGRLETLEAERLPTPTLLRLLAFIILAAVVIAVVAIALLTRNPG